MSTGEHPTDHARPAAAGAEAPEPDLTVLVYSDDPRTREQVRLALGRRPASDLPRVSYVEHDSADAVVDDIDAGGVDLAILDGEAVPTGGMGLARQLKNEVRSCPPILLLTGRRDDYWLATWSQADAAVSHPIDAMELADAAVALLRSVHRRPPVIRSR